MYLTAGKTKRPRKTKFQCVISARYLGYKHAPCICHDRSSKMRSLVDTGADVSVLLVMFKDKHIKSKFTLCAANGTLITTFGQKLLQLDFGLRRNFQWPFYIAKISKPILSIAFMSHFNLLVDIRRRRLV